ncbi:sulfotransferase domain-containing protein [Rhodobacter maris]|uniref:Sulfotransferase domain-containing protein n=1 Tax=Rhodobacter maris TaxID=446682 RepID=A0A285TFA4_9RHOB|nr:sulfotransferase domain-containing protein [Rhodobacter maris]SOC20408.1 sulfotransferase domain-containing protein [Rhodobacter maris]
MNRFRNRVASIALRNYLRGPRARRGNFIVSGYPKSGTTWATQLAAALAGLDYHQGDVRFRLRGIALHTHSTAFKGRDNILYCVRDPRESVCSAARAMANSNRDGVYGPQGQITEDFITYATTTLPGARKTMRDHLQDGIDQGWEFVRFEDLKTNPKDTLGRLAAHFGWSASADDIAATIEKYDFTRQQQRHKGNVFFAQSSLSSWAELLSPVALDRMETALGAQAGAFGYDLSSRPAPKA